MKPIAYIMLAFVLIITIFVKFIPIPFLGLIAGFCITPLAHLLSWRDLLTINLFYMTIVQVSSIESFQLALSLVQSFVPLFLIPNFYIVAYGFFLALTFFMAIYITALQKVFYYCLPKRLRIERLGY